MTTVPFASRPVHAVLLSLVIVLAATTGCTNEPAPDRILLNAHIWTGDSANPEAQAIAMRGDRIVAVGSDAEIRRRADGHTRVEDLGGHRVVPGFHDAHWHLPTRRTADLVNAADEKVVVARLREFAATLPADAWITGRGWTPEMFPRRVAHRKYLDAVFPDRPALIIDRDGHQTLANSRALALAGVSAETRDPAGGAIVRDADGSPTGLLQETASGLVRRLLPEPSAEEVYGALRSEMHRAAGFGLTSIQVANGLNDVETAAFERALVEDSMIVRFRVAVPFVRDVSDSVLRAYVTLRDRHAGPLLHYGIAKGMLDGTVDAGTAAMLAPYAIGGGTGLPRWSAEDLATAVATYDRAGLQVELHAIGDRAIRMALDAFESAAHTNGARDSRHRVEHLEVPDLADIPRFASLGVLASTQAIFATPDANALGNYAPMLGPVRASHALPFKALDDAHAIQPFGSDYPVYPMDPLLGIYTAVTRQLPDGSPKGGWYPEHRIAVVAALAHYTRDAAYSAFREHEIGVLRAGMLADLVVLSEEIVGTAPAALLRAKSLLTIVGGRDSYRPATADAARR